MTADYRVVLGPEELEITFDVPAADAPEAMTLLARVLRAPALDDADVAALARRTTRPSPAQQAGGESGPVLYQGSLEAAVDLFHAHLLDGHRYAPTLSDADAAALTVTHVRDFHERYFRGTNIVLAVSGDIGRDEATRLLRDAFAGFPGGRAPARTASPPPPPPEARVAHVQPIDKLQGWVVMGHVLEPVARQDEAALLVMNYILGGGHFDARLFIEVRDKRGLANTAGSFPEWRRRGPGSYTLRTYGRPETVPLLIRILQDEVDRIRTQPVTEESLRVAKGALRDGEFAMWFHNGEATARTFARERLHDGDHRGTATFRERIAAVTAADVQAAANRFLHRDRMRMVVIGPLDRIRRHTPLEGEPPLDAFGRIIEAR
jgi:zinc protease